MTRRAAFLPAALALVCAAILPRLADRGMFLDGVTYASIARNLAAGLGTVWHPHYTRTVYPDFHEQPPLGLALEALAFRAAGDHLLVERLFSFLLALLSAGLLVWIWRLAPGGTQAPQAWMPVVFWIAAPVVSWSFVHNMLENVQGVFTLLATGAALKGVGAGPSRSRAAWGGVSGIAVAGAVLAKGPVGFFPLAAPWTFATASWWWRGGRATGVGRAASSGAIVVGAVQLAVLVTMAAAAWSYEPARESLGTYVRQQVQPTLGGERETSSSRLRFVKTLGQELLPMAILSGGLLLWWRRRYSGSSAGAPDVAAAFLLLALAASLPLVLSPKQSGHYVVPSMAMYALACASATSRAGAALLPSWGRAARAAPWFAAAIAAAAATWLAIDWGATRRDGLLLGDLDRIFTVVPAGSTMGLCPAAAAEWGLHAYAQRLWRASLDTGSSRHRWHIVLPLAGCAAPSGCRDQALETVRLRLYECGGAAARSGPGIAQE